MGKTHLEICEGHRRASPFIFLELCWFLTRWLGLAWFVWM
jgi:hypothetical protein